MEQTGEPGLVHASEATMDRVFKSRLPSFQPGPDGRIQHPVIFEKGPPVWMEKMNKNIDAYFVKKVLPIAKYELLTTLPVNISSKSRSQTAAIGTAAALKALVSRPRIVSGSLSDGAAGEGKFLEPSSMPLAQTSPNFTLSILGSGPPVGSLGAAAGLAALTAAACGSYAAPPAALAPSVVSRGPISAAFDDSDATSSIAPSHSGVPAANPGAGSKTRRPSRSQAASDEKMDMPTQDADPEESSRHMKLVLKALERASAQNINPVFLNFNESGMEAEYVISYINKYSHHVAVKLTVIAFVYILIFAVDLLAFNYPVVVFPRIAVVFLILLVPMVIGYEVYKNKQGKPGMKAYAELRGIHRTLFNVAGKLNFQFVAVFIVLAIFGAQMLNVLCIIAEPAMEQVDFYTGLQYLYTQIYVILVVSSTFFRLRSMVMSFSAFLIVMVYNLVVFLALPNKTPMPFPDLTYFQPIIVMPLLLGCIVLITRRAEGMGREDVSFPSSLLREGFFFKFFFFILPPHSVPPE
jgi:hypothetical protein